MYLKNLKKYKLNQQNNKVINDYIFLIKNKKINKKKKNRLINAFKATVKFIDWNFKVLNKFEKKKIKKFEDLFNYNQKYLKKSVKLNLTNIISNLIINIFKIFPLFQNNFYGPGFLEKNIFRRLYNFLNYKLLLKKLDKIEFQNLKKNKDEFIRILNGSNIKKNQLIEILPDFFFSDEIKNLSNLKVNLNGSSDLIFKNNISKLFISNCNFNFINWVHGGAYYEYKKSYLESFEKNLIGKYPKIINKKIYDNNNFKSSKVELVFALRSPLIKADKYMNPNLYKHLNNKENFNIMKPLIKKYNFKIRPHPRGLNNVYKNYKFKNISYNIQKNNIFIFDSISSSLIFWLLVKKIPFIYIIKNLNMKNLHSRVIDYIKSSEDNNCFLFFENDKKTKRFLDKLISNKININNILKTNKKIFDNLK